jgi:enoyl-[acyl-carrier-protein] reductase (NADH)
MDEAVIDLNRKRARIAGIANLDAALGQSVESAPMQRAAMIENMSAAAPFLASDHALNIIEAVIPADAGSNILD